MRFGGGDKVRRTDIVIERPKQKSLKPLTLQGSSNRLKGVSCLSLGVVAQRDQRVVLVSGPAGVAVSALPPTYCLFAEKSNESNAATSGRRFHAGRITGRDRYYRRPGLDAAPGRERGS